MFVDGFVNVVIFCFVLMGINWLDFVEEVYCILYWKGEFWVVEIKFCFMFLSRIKVVIYSVGNRCKNVKVNMKVDFEDDGVEDFVVEVDGVDDRRCEIDVLVFVEVLWKRGFVLYGEKGEVVDLLNKMFVKM